MSPARGGRSAGKSPNGSKSSGPKSSGPKSSKGGPRGNVAGPKSSRKAAAPRGGTKRAPAAKRGAMPKAAAPAKGAAKGAKPMSSAAKKAVEAKQARHAAASVRKADRPGGTRRARGEGDRPIARGQAIPRGLGGDQVEGRQAVRELLLAGRRRVREVMVAEEQENNDTLLDIIELAQDMKIPVREVTRTKLFSVARTESPQGVVARADELEDQPKNSFLGPAFGYGGGLGLKLQLSEKMTLQLSGQFTKFATTLSSSSKAFESSGFEDRTPIDMSRIQAGGVLFFRL